MKTKSGGPSLKVAWHQALASLRVRSIRHMFTVAGIFLSTAFLTLVLCMREGESPGEGRDRLTWLATSALVMCTVGITNSMLLSVAERFREIGTFRCLGCTPGFIVQVFLIESFILGTSGSLFGTLAGILGATQFGGALGTPVQWSQALPVLPLCFALGFGISILSAIPPVIQAARIPAAAALRSEV